MKKINTLILLALGLLLSLPASAGNKDRSGQAGASELLINPWARNAGLHMMNSSFAQGIEAMRINVAGLAFTRKTQVNFASTLWLQGSGVKLNAVGFAQRLGESGVLGLNMVSVSVGDIPVTTVANPDGDSGASFRPSMLNLGLAYAQSFSKSIHVGFLFRIINESIQDVSATGAAFDMGIQYVTGPKDDFRFGISLRNIGTPMRYAGDGLAYSLIAPQGYNYTINQRTEKFELPSVLNIGVSYDIHMGEKNVFTIMGNFTSNSFTKDYIGGGVEYAFNKMFMLRVGYRYEEGGTGNLSLEERSSAYTGLAAGLSIEVPFKKDGPAIGIDYGYRHTNPWNGTHTMGIRFNL